jgi:hypothetical protein
VFLVNQGSDEVDLDLALAGAQAGQYPVFGVWRTDREHKAEPLGRVQVQDGLAHLALPPRSLTTLFPAGAAVEPVDPNA